MTTRELLDDDGENLALRTFLAFYGNNPTVTIGAMKDCMETSGWDNHPEFVSRMSDWSMTKGTAQMWIRHLLSLEQALEKPEQDDERFVNGALPMGGMGFRIVDKAAEPEQKPFNPNPYASKLPGPMGSFAQPEQISVMSGSCAECGVKARDGYALYCVACTDLFTQPEQEPVAWLTKDLMADYLDAIADAVSDNNAEFVRHKAYWLRREDV